MHTLQCSGENNTETGVLGDKKTYEQNFLKVKYESKPGHSEKFDLSLRYSKHLNSLSQDWLLSRFHLQRQVKSVSLELW